MILNYFELKRLSKEQFDVNILVKDHQESRQTSLDAFSTYQSEVSIDENDFLISTSNLKTNQIFIDVNMTKDITSRKAQILAKKIAKEIKKNKNVSITFETKYEDALTRQFLKKLGLSLDGFTQYITTGLKREKDATPIEHPIPTLSVFGVDKDLVADINHRIKAVSFAKYLVNEPANKMTPCFLAQEAENFSLNHNIDVSIKGLSKIKELEMDAFLSVARGSDEEPKLIVMRYMNNPDSEEKIALVGKGVTYDSGGLAIKPATGMVTMHADMGGSAAVIGAINLLAMQNAKVNVVAIVAACENMISGHAYRNGDIISSMSKKNIEIINTDAEGRLTLADGIWYAHEVEKADKIIDIATLTGAVFAALGDSITGVISDDDDFYKHLETASETIGDKIWRLPCDEELAQCNKSKRADIRNSGNCGAGTTTAGLFLRTFANKLPWTHLDIAGTAYKSESDFDPEGASGVGVELLADAVTAHFNQ